MGDVVTTMRSKPGKPGEPDDCPEEVLYWIAWYPDHLTDEQRGAVEAHAAECADCRGELDMIAGTAPAPAGAPPADATYARVKARISEGKPAPASAPRRLESRPAWRPASWAAAAALVLVVGSTGFYLGPQLRGSEPVYLPATEPGNSPGSAAGPMLQVVFSPETSIATLADTLRSVGATIVEGPSPRGMYILRAAPGADPTVVARVLKQSGVAALAEPQAP